MVGIIFIGDIKYCPYLKIYEKTLQQSGTNYHFLFWNRTSFESTHLPCNYIPFQKGSRLNKNKLSKLIDFWCYRRWLKARLLEEKYDKLILLSTLSGMILADVILRHYKKRYILDIRDYSYERIYPFYKIEEALLHYSLLNCISSKGFKNFLPPSVEYTPVHNITGFNNKDVYHFTKKNYGSTLNIVWNGAVRYFSQQRKIIEKLGNDKRFSVFYYGSGAEFDEYQSFLRSKNFYNVFLMGPYDNSEKDRILKDADIINSSYQFSIETEFAMPNKFYDGIIYKIPQLVEVNTYKCREVEKLNLGIGLDVDCENFADQLYEYYFSINEEDFNAKCDETLKLVLQENEAFIQQVRKSLLLPPEEG